MRIVFVTNDRLAQQRAGPAIRCLELARVLARRHEVILASAQPGGVELDGIVVLTDTAAHPARLRALVARAGVVVVQGLALARFPFLRAASHLVVDLYDPYLLEYLAHPHPRFASWGYLRQWYLVNQQLLRGDFFLCANERQWDYWLGRLCALGRLTPAEFNSDPSFRRLMGVVPFGISSQPPAHTQNVLKGVVPGIEKDDTVVLWAGGIWQWLDPLTVIRAMSLLQKQQPRVKLVFMGTKDPNPANREMPMVAACRELAAGLGLLDRSVFFLQGWVPFAERVNYLLEADIGISAHLQTVESRFAFRTRVLDYIWAGLPMLLTRGDYFADMAERHGLGATVASGDAEAWAQALAALSNDRREREAIKCRLRQIAPEFYWENVAQPLLRYCDQPYPAHRGPGLRRVVVPLLSRAYQWFKSR
jgi:glycosyltransferase involved in cell wall biosynthesis